MPQLQLAVACGLIDQLAMLSLLVAAKTEFWQPRYSQRRGLCPTFALLLFRYTV